MLSLKNLSIGYGKTVVLKSITTAFEPGTLTALIGSNGSGKSSFLRAISGLQDHGGIVLLNGTAADSRVRTQRIAYMPQDTGSTSSLTLLEVVLLGRIGSLGLRIPVDLINGAEQVLGQFGLRDLQNRTLDQVSGGQRQLAFLAQSLFRSPDVLLLDEPTSALDLRHQLMVLHRVQEQVCANQIIGIAAMHDLTLAANFADRIICLGNGEVLADGPPQSVLTVALLEEAYRVRADFVQTEAGKLAVLPDAAL